MSNHIKINPLLYIFLFSLVLCACNDKKPSNNTQQNNTTQTTNHLQDIANSYKTALSEHSLQDSQVKIEIYPDQTTQPNALVYEMQYTQLKAGSEQSKAIASEISQMLDAQKQTLCANSMLQALVTNGELYKIVYKDKDNQYLASAEFNMSECKNHN